MSAAKETTMQRLSLLAASIAAVTLAGAWSTGCSHTRQTGPNHPSSGAPTGATAPSASSEVAARDTPAGEGSTSTASVDGAPQVVTRELVYSAGELPLKGYLAYPAGVTGKRPGVLVVHEWWGLNDYVRKRARMLAQLGYVALAVDMYGEGKSTEHPEDAKKFMMEVVSQGDASARRFAAAKAALVTDPHVDPDKIAAIGYCFGGAVVLGAARRGEDLDLVASFHGNYATTSPMPANAFEGKLFIAHGAADSFVPEAQAEALKRELDAAGADYEFVSYEGAKHGFTNPDADRLAQKGGLDVAYDTDADARSWQRLVELLAQVFPEQ